MAKYMARSEAATAKDKAAKLMETTGQGDRAAEFRRMSVEDYAQHRGVTLMENPARSRRGLMPTKADLEDQVEQLTDLLEEALDAELSREEVIGKLKEMKDVLEDEDEADSDEDEDDEEEDEDQD